ncbi:lysosomal acid lipase/cholesteryl ester hydrolase-like [Belonocnema kinseyi]|uniref:lysosomal acid lipase/cholesteryl ester hydrolase-like n=1 Tax=Belonocnema kinseyi TaxID=2817044 RepID=UPI00143D45A0|nr:lysosomal acid lipase/cholesteryl ester hydrolase-like [Belonocnema kinseyi]
MKNRWTRCIDRPKRRLSTVLQLLTYVCIVVVSSVPQDLNNQIRQIITDDGYPFEEYNLKTQDGYFLTIHRIPGGNGESINKTQPNKPIAYLVHALTQSSIDWVSIGRNVSLAYLLADKGFDVWLGNNRGTIFAQKHQTYSTTSSSFWNFSWHESGVIDIPETIDFILNETGKSEIFFVGYSQSCTELVVMGSLKPEYNKKITLAVNMAPAVFTGHVKGLLWLPLMILGRFISGILDNVGHFGIIVSPFLVYIDTFIFKHRISTFLIFILIYSASGIDYNGTDLEVVRKEIVYIPGGLSTKQLTHYSFGFINPGTFRQYDYGKSENMRKYNSTIPPDYPLEKVTVPIAIFQGLQDFLASPEDVEILVNKLPNVVCRKKFKQLSHTSFAWTRGVKKLAYEKIVDLFINYGRNKSCN